MRGLWISDAYHFAAAAHHVVRANANDFARHGRAFVEFDAAAGAAVPWASTAAPMPISDVSNPHRWICCVVMFDKITPGHVRAAELA
jgi:hypothetical protein